MGRGRTLHPPIGLGLWNLGRWEPDAERAAREVTQAALSYGVPWLDTAEVYGAGRSERLIGDLLTHLPSGRVAPFLTTKLSWEHLRASQVRPSILGSLRRLGRPRVDLYLVHAPDPHVKIAETIAAMEELVREGLVGAIGVSNFSLEEMEEARAALGEGEIVANQVRFNLFEREDADPILDYCRTHRIVVEAYTPLARGLLAGRFLTGAAPRRPDARADRGVYAAESFPLYQARARKLDALARGAGLPMASLALHAIARRGAAPAFGVGSPGQIAEVYAAWRARPSDALLDEAERIARGDAD